MQSSTNYLMPPYLLDNEKIDGLAKRTQAVFEQVIEQVIGV